MTEVVSIDDLEYYHMFDKSIPVDALITEYDSNPEVFATSGGILYCIPLLKHIDLSLLSDDTLNRMICRCVEHDLQEQLEYILSCRIDCNKNLLLRKIGSPEIYSLVQSYGYKDIELDKRITWFQRAIRARRNKIRPSSVCRSALTHTYEGPDISDHYKNNRYYGYRYAIHKTRWDRKGRSAFYSTLLTLDCWGNCEWQAYIDYMGLRVEDCPRA